ncbi:MAG: DUF1700 domain-containing protein [Lachnospiraceae bacterium]|nr:DUF1700 domain-containing protein [Lachnospiraceae bacterium]
MSRAEFMEKLKTLLADIPDGEREEALNYYEDYFEDAGVENEQQVIDSLGSPEKVAKTIKDGLHDVAGEQGEFSENGYSGYGKQEKDEVIQYGTEGKKKFSDRIKGLGNGGLILILILAIFALPILGPVVTGIVSALIGILVAVAAVLFALVIAGIALLVAGASVFAAAIGCLFVTPPVGIMLLGASLLILGIGILITVLGIWVVTKVVPPVIRWVVRSVRKIFEKKEV